MPALISPAEKTNTRLCGRLLQSFTAIAIIDDEGMTAMPKSKDPAAVARRLSYEDSATLRVFGADDHPCGEIRISIEDDDWVYAEGDGQHEDIEDILVEIFGEC